MNNAIGVSDDRHKSNQDPPCIITPGFLPRAPFLWACIGDVPQRSPDRFPDFLHFKDEETEVH